MSDLAGVANLVVGAGFSGAVIARRIAEDLGQDVAVIDRRDHVGGNCHSAPDPETGIECHTYGSHIFHTSNERVWAFLNRFTRFNDYRHKVYTMSGGRVFHMPVNLHTINEFFGRNMNPAQAREFMAERIARDSVAEPANLQEKAISLIGRELYEAFVRGYTRKHWDTDPTLLPAETIARLPFRWDYNCEYFNDPHQGLPLDGYGALFAELLDHEGISLHLGVDFSDLRPSLGEHTRVFYTGPIDGYFDYRLGELTWRSLRFERDVRPVTDFQGTAVMNYADAGVPHTRIHEFRHYHPEREHPEGRTVTVTEFPAAWNRGDEPYYPVNTPRDRELLAEYTRLAEQEAGTLFCGRLGNYRYQDMDQTVLRALELCDGIIEGQRT